jgi:hypothetical protein
MTAKLVNSTPTKATELDLTQPDDAIKAYVVLLPKCWKDFQADANRAFYDDEYFLVKAIASAHSGDSYCRALAYLCSVKAVFATDRLPVILSEIADRTAKAHADAARAKLDALTSQVFEKNLATLKEV